MLIYTLAYHTPLLTGSLAVASLISYQSSTFYTDYLATLSFSLLVVDLDTSVVVWLTSHHPMIREKFIDFSNWIIFLMCTREKEQPNIQRKAMFCPLVLFIPTVFFVGVQKTHLSRLHQSDFPLASLPVMWTNGRRQRSEVTIAIHTSCWRQWSLCWCPLPLLYPCEHPLFRGSRCFSLCNFCGTSSGMCISARIH